MSLRTDVKFGSRSIKSKAIWWIPQKQKVKILQMEEKLSISTTLKHILQHVSFHCYDKIVEHGRSIWERLLWLIFHVIAFVVLVMFLNQIRDSKHKVQTSLFDPIYPVQKTEFPAVSICPFNTMNQHAVWEYAKNLSQKDPQGHEIGYFYKNIQMLKSFYQIEQNIQDNDAAVIFQYFLDTYDVEKGKSFNILETMRKISPRCKDLQVSCSLAGKTFPCEDQFKESLFRHGVCCTYNSQGGHSFERGFINEFVGFSNSLQLVLNTSIVDHNNQIIDHTDFVVLVYSPKDFADDSLGAVNFKIARSGEYTAVIVKPSLFITEEEARIYKPKTRNCLFVDEMPDTFLDSYSFSKCILRCRTRSIYVLCGCILFTTPLEYLDEPDDAVYCTLQNLVCLQRYQFKWNNIITQRAHFRNLQREMEDGLYCPHCLPNCLETTYELTSQEWSFDLRGATGNNLSGVHVYLGGAFVSLYKQVQKNKWFEEFSNVGSICGIIMGFSLIGIFEILYFVIKHSYYKYQNARKTSVHNKSEQSADNRKLSNIHEDFIILP